MCSLCHGDSCTNVEETMIDITDIAINDDTQDEELFFEKVMQMPMQDDSQHVNKEEEEEEEEEFFYFYFYFFFFAEGCVKIF